MQNGGAYCHQQLGVPLFYRTNYQDKTYAEEAYEHEFLKQDDIGITGKRAG